MKFTAGLAIAASLASSAAAAAASAPVYLLRPASAQAATTSSSSPPSLPRQIARQILLQRIHADDGSSFLETLPDNYDAEAALDALHQYGVKTPPLFDEVGPDSADGTSRRHPRQLVVVVEGVQPAHVKAFEAALPAAVRKPAFVVADPPSSVANRRFLVDELRQVAGMNPVERTDVTTAFGADFPASWENGLFVGLYDMKKNPATIDILANHLPQILTLTDGGDVEALLVLLPESSRFSKLSHWTTRPLAKAKTSNSKQPQRDEISELKARKVDESVIAEDIVVGANDKAAHDKAANKEFTSPHEFVAVPTAPIPSCFQSFNACVTQTGNCSSHGTCVDKYAVNSGTGAGGSSSAAAPAGVCFVCHCFSTLNRPEDSPGGLSTTHWAGNMCQKKDVSVPFWLLTGFSVTIVGAITFAIGLLFNVGEEKLPGVIGAGVSRAK